MNYIRSHCGWIRLIGQRWLRVCEYADRDIVERVMERRYGTRYEWVILPEGVKPVGQRHPA